MTGVVGHLLRIEWVTGEESTFMPGPGSVTVLGKGRPSGASKAMKATTAKKGVKAAGAEKAAKKAAPKQGPGKGK